MIYLINFRIIICGTYIVTDVLYIFLLDPYIPYTCEKKACFWETYEENTDWGYYSRTNGDCSSCQDQCSMDKKCGAVECGEYYCSWWKVGKCSTSTDEEHHSGFKTCRKRK